MIPPPNPNEKDFSTCQNCQAKDAKSKKRKREGAIVKVPCSGPVTRHQDDSSSTASRAWEGIDIADEDELTKVVSTHPMRENSILTGHISLQCLPTVKSYLMHYGRPSKRKNKSIFSVPIVYQKILWSAIAKGLG
jgi:hypothetical protein